MEYTNILQKKFPQHGFWNPLLLSKFHFNLVFFFFFALKIIYDVTKFNVVFFQDNVIEDQSKNFKTLFNSGNINKNVKR